jgi:hypothetical protein
MEYRIVGTSASWIAATVAMLTLNTQAATWTTTDTCAPGFAGATDNSAAIPRRHLVLRDNLPLNVSRVYMTGGTMALDSTP